MWNSFLDCPNGKFSNMISQAKARGSFIDERVFLFSTLTLHAVVGDGIKMSPSWFKDESRHFLNVVNMRMVLGSEVIVYGHIF